MICILALRKKKILAHQTSNYETVYINCVYFKYIFIKICFTTGQDLFNRYSNLIRVMANTRLENSSGLHAIAHLAIQV